MDPALQNILATLAQYGPPAQAVGSVEYNNRTSTPTTAFSAVQNAPIDRPHSTAVDAHPKPQTRSTASPQPVIDPATITTWQDGLRCVTKLAAQNAAFASSIRRMIEDQRKREMRWYAERQNLKRTQAARADSTSQANTILQSLGSGNASGWTDAASESHAEDELAAFDRRTYTAQKAMDEVVTAELKSLGVPFFGTNPDAIIVDSDLTSPDIRDQNRPKWSPIVTEPQLLELRRRMVRHLEDLYRD